MFNLNILLYIVNPIFGLLVSYIGLIKSSKIKLRNLFLYYFLLAFYLGLINSTKIPENDLDYHANHYLMVSGFNLLEYLILIGKEPFFYIFNFIFYRISGGSVQLWVLTMSTFSYYLYFVALHKFHSRFNQSISFLLFSVSCAAFFPQLFSLSAHLLRQFPAGIIFIYYFIELAIYKKNKWWIAVIGIGIHSTTILLYLLSNFIFLREKITLKNFLFPLFTLLVLVNYQFLVGFIFTKLPFIPFISYILERGSVDTEFDLGAVTMINKLYLFVTLISIIYFQYARKLYLKDEGFNLIFNVITYLIFFIFFNLHQSELANRFIFYVWMIFPLFFPLFFISRYFVLVRKVVASLLLIWFIYRLENGIWQYSEISELLFSPVISYFL